MSKKNFKSGFEGLLGEAEKDLAEPFEKKHTNKMKNEKKATFVVDADQYEKLKAISYWERKMIKEILYGVLERFFTEYQTEKGKIITPSSKNESN